MYDAISIRNSFFLKNMVSWEFQTIILSFYETFRKNSDAANKKLE